jgi:hypothetical protein
MANFLDPNLITTNSVKSLRDNHAVETAKEKRELKQTVEKALDAQLPTPVKVKAPSKKLLNDGLKMMGQKAEKDDLPSKRKKLRKIRLYQQFFERHCPKGVEKLGEKTPMEDLDEALSHIKESISLESLKQNSDSFFSVAAETFEQVWTHSPLGNKMLLQGFSQAFKTPAVRKKYKLDETLMQLAIEHHEFFGRSVYWNLAQGLTLIARDVHIGNVLRRSQLAQAEVSQETVTMYNTI